MLHKRIISIFTALACTLSIICTFGGVLQYSSNMNTVSALEDLSAGDITSQMTIGWNLGNSLDCYNNSYTITTEPKSFATCWGNPEPTNELIETVKNAGFNTIRIPTTWYQHIVYDEATNTYSIDQTWLEYVKSFVDYAYSLDMFVILNVHHEEGVINVDEFTDETLEKAKTHLTTIWTTLAETFKDYDQHLIFEGMNEPRQKNNTNVSEWGDGSGDNGYTWDYINTLNEVFINCVRSNGSTYNNQRLLMIPGYCASSSVNAIKNIQIPENSGNIALSVHAYVPYYFTMATDDKANHEFPGSSGWGEDYEFALDNLFSSLNEVSIEKNVPIIIGEFGASDFENTSDRVAWAKYYLTLAKQYNIPCVLWDNNVSANGTGEAHGYIYRLTNTIYPNSMEVLQAMMDTVGVTEYTLPEYKEYKVPNFYWEDMPITDDWQEIYYNKTGKSITSGKTLDITTENFKDYLTSNYKIAVLYKSTEKPNLILQDNVITEDETQAEEYISYFTYNDILSILQQNDTSLDSIESISIGANSGTILYGVYAVPTSSEEISETLGDVNGDSKVNVADLIFIRKYILHVDELSESGYAMADYNQDGKVNVADLIAIRQYILHISVEDVA